MPWSQPETFQTYTRDGKVATVFIDTNLPEPWRFAGRIGKFNQPIELWDCAGFWRESHEPHPLDLTGHKVV